MPPRMFAWIRFAVLTSWATVCGPRGAFMCLFMALAALPWQPITVHAFSTETLATARSGDITPGSNAPAANEILEIRTNSVSAGEQATLVFRRAEMERGAYSECENIASDCHPRLRQWRASLERLRDLNGLELLRTLNATLNELVRYRDDLAAYGADDHWATPVESLTGHGDCEDYAILKYLTLRELGYSASQLRIRIVLDTNRNVGHAVLTADLGGQTYVLDNLSSEPKDQSSVARYKPLYSVNENGKWLILAVRSRTAVVAMQRENEN